MSFFSRGAASLAIAAAAMVASACSQSQSSSTLSGKVILDGAPDSSGVIVLVAGRLQNEDSVVTAADGSYLFHISSDKDARYTVSAFAPWSLERVQGTFIDVKAGESPTLPDIDFTATGALTGSVSVAGSTGGAGGVLVSVDGTDALAMTASDGSFTLRDVPVGTFTVRAQKAGYSDAVVAGQVVAYAKTTAVGALTLTGK